VTGPDFSVVAQALVVVAIMTAVALFAAAVREKIRFIVAGKPDTQRFDRLTLRLRRVLREVLGQSKVIGGRKGPGLLHALIFWGFWFFILGTLEHFALAGHVQLLGSGSLAHWYHDLLTIAAGLVLLGVVALTFRRYLIRPPNLTHPSTESGIILSLITILMITYLVADRLSDTIQSVNWWVHTLTVLGFMAYIPRSKHLHLIAAPFSVFFKNFYLGRLPLLDFEDDEVENFGIKEITDLTWKQKLDLFACIQCGRCSDLCPALGTGKHLDPKMIIMDLKAGQEAAVGNTPIIGSLIQEADIWQCTTCGACENVCPTGDEHLPLIIGLRRARVAESQFPKEAVNAFTNLEKTGNPWGYAPGSRGDRLQALNMPIFNDSHEYCFWLGCFNNYNPEYESFLRTIRDLLQTAGVTFGVLAQESCSGEPARRMGNEYLYQTLAASNIERFQKAGVQKILTTCPHCLQIIGNDYKQMNGNFKVIHHTQLLADLVKNDRLKIQQKTGDVVTYHDPCYLGRYNRIFAEPRALVEASQEQTVELPRHGERSFCCGAGGGMFFMEEREGKRINHERVDEVIQSGAKTLVTGCPFCKSMLGDGIRDKGREDSIRIRDAAELLMESLVNTQEAP